MLRTWRWNFLLLVFLLPGSSPRWRAAAQNPGSQKTSSTDSLDLHLGNGYEALKQEQYEVAEKEFRAALGIDSSLSMRARFPLAVSLFEQHKSAESRREFEMVRKAAGELPGILYYLGRLGLDEQNY